METLILLTLITVSYATPIVSQNRVEYTIYDDKNQLSVCISTNGTNYICSGDSSYCCYYEDGCFTIMNSKYATPLIFFSVLIKLFICISFCHIVYYTRKILRKLRSQV